MLDDHVFCLSAWNQTNVCMALPENTKKLTSISFIIICKDEARCIRRCIQSIVAEKTKEDEIIVIDTGSTDNTLEIIREFKECKLVKAIWKNDFSEIRNLGIVQACKDWIFFIDADESLVKESVKNLKRCFSLLDYSQAGNIIISPMIINSNTHMIREVKRIFIRGGNIKYYGAIHEEPRKMDGMMGADLAHLYIDNVILNHDGYKKECVIRKNKLQRNMHLLYQMIQKEPSNPRWKYFLCRDGKSTINANEYEKMLEEVIELAGQKPFFVRYKSGAYSDLAGFYIEHAKFKRAEFCINELEKIKPGLSDVIYYRGLLKYQERKMENVKLMKKLVNYRISRTECEYGGIHSGYFHIEALIAMLLMDIGEYEKAFQVYNSLETYEFGEYKEFYKKLYLQLKEFLNLE